MVVKSLDYSRRLKPTPVPARMHVARTCRYRRGLVNGKAGEALMDAKLMLAVELSQILTCVLVKIKCNLSRRSFNDYQFNIIIEAQKPFDF
jgi:hypothetical protein